MDNLHRSLSNYDKTKASRYPELPGELGIPLGGGRLTEVPNRPHFVYVRLRSNQSEVIQAYNDRVFPSYGLPVIVQWRETRYEVIERDKLRYPKWEQDNPYLIKHGKVHSLNKDANEIGSDPVWIYSYNFIPSLVSPFPESGAQNVYIHPYNFNFNGTWKYTGNTGTASLVGYSPTSGSVLVLVSLDSITGNPALFATTGTYIPPTVTGTVELSSYLPSILTSRYIPLSFIQLISGTSQIGWNNLFDVRQFLKVAPTGSAYLTVNGAYPINRIETEGVTFSSTGTVAFLEFAGGSGASLNFQDEGVPLGVPGTVNFVGDNVVVTVSGSVARVYVTGSFASPSNSLPEPIDVTGSVGVSSNYSRADHVHTLEYWDGWFPISETWTRTGNHSFTVSGDLTARYRKGTKIRYKDGGSFEYGVVVSSSYSAPNTTINLQPNSDYTMAAATITETAISYIANPEGFPHNFNFTVASMTGNGSMTVTSFTATTAIWRVSEGKLEINVLINPFAIGGTPNTQITIGTGLTWTGSSAGILNYRDSGSGVRRVGTGTIIFGSSNLNCRKEDNSNWSTGADRQIQFWGSVEL